MCLVCRSRIFTLQDKRVVHNTILETLAKAVDLHFVYLLSLCAECLSLICGHLL